MSGRGPLIEEGPVSVAGGEQPGNAAPAPRAVIARAPWYRYVGDRRGAFSALAVLPVVYRMLTGPSLPHDVFELRDPLPRVLGVALLLLGALIRCWAAGHVRKSQEVTRVGPYSLVRHPLYLGTFSAWLGFLVLSGDPPLGVQTLLLLWFAVYYPRILTEEWRLTDRFGSAYPAYREEVPMMLPWRGVRYRPGRWDARRAWREKGFRLLLLLPLVLVLLAMIEEWKQGRLVLWSLRTLLAP